jgi:hypothetical protein
MSTFMLQEADPQLSKILRPVFKMVCEVNNLGSLLPLYINNLWQVSLDA